MHVPTAKGTDRSTEDERQDHERDGQPVKFEFEGEVIVRDIDPPLEHDRHVPNTQPQHH